MNINLKELLKKDFGVDLPISGGVGNSIDNPIVIHLAKFNDYVGTEYSVLECIGKGRGIEWKIVEQGLLSHRDKKIDKVKIETIELTVDSKITQIENYYFDITECFGKSTFNPEILE